jgi:hypothetical protein
VYGNEFNGEIGFHYYNEPCLYKKQMFEIMGECSFAKFLLWTNGTLFDNNMADNDFLKKFHNIVISNYDGKARYAYYAELQKAYPNISRIIDYSAIDDLDNRKTIYENEPSNIFGCVRPFDIELPIDCYGNVHLCCRDYNNSCVIGNVKTQSILNIIRSETYCSYENSIKRPLLDLKNCPDVCKKCDAPDKLPPQTIQYDNDPLPKISAAAGTISFVIVSNGRNIDDLVLLIKNLQRLKDVRLDDEIVIILDNDDSGVFEKISKEADKVFTVPGKGSFEAYSRDILKYCGKEWIFRMDDDETLSESCSRELLNYYVLDRDIASYWLLRRWYVSKKEYIVTLPWYPDHQLRLFRNSPAILTLPLRIHEAIKVEGKSEKIDAFHIKHWDLAVHSREERENKVSYYEKLLPGNLCGHFYLYEDNSDIDVFKDNPNVLKKNKTIQNNSDIDNASCFRNGFLKKIMRAFSTKISASHKSDGNYILSNVPEIQKIGLHYGVEILAHFGNAREAEAAYKNNKIFFSYHWFNEDKTVSRWDNNREQTPMNYFEDIYCIMTVTPPSQAGVYYLQIDVVEECVKWYTRSGEINSPMIRVSVV